MRMQKSWIQPLQTGTGWCQGILHCQYADWTAEMASSSRGSNSLWPGPADAAP